MLDEGYQTTTLYTDLANPTSNKIYQEIGYEQIAESVLIFLESKKACYFSTPFVIHQF